MIKSSHRSSNSVPGEDGEEEEDGEEGEEGEEGGGEKESHLC